MSKHLPECPNSRFTGMPELLYDCFICGMLRACEERVKDDWYATQSATWVQGCEMFRAREQRVAKEYRNREMNGLAWMDGYDHGVDAAREAVEQASSLLQPLGPALAAIDALMEKP